MNKSDFSCSKQTNTPQILANKRSRYKKFQPSFAILPISCVNIKKSGKHRTGMVGREHSGLLGPTSLLKQGLPRAHGTRLHPDSSCISPVEETPQLLWVERWFGYFRWSPKSPKPSSPLLQHQVSLGSTSFKSRFQKESAFQVLS